MDFASLISDAKDSISQGMGDLLNQGGNAALGYLEGQAVAALKADQDQHIKEAQAGISKSLASIEHSSLGDYLKNLVQAPLLKENGGKIMLVVGAIAIGGYLLLKR